MRTCILGRAFCVRIGKVVFVAGSRGFHMNMGGGRAVILYGWGSCAWHGVVVSCAHAVRNCCGSLHMDWWLGFIRTGPARFDDGCVSGGIDAGLDAG